MRCQNPCGRGQSQNQYSKSPKKYKESHYQSSLLTHIGFISKNTYLVDVGIITIRVALQSITGDFAGTLLPLCFVKLDP